MLNVPQLGSCWHEGKLPSSLLAFLHAPCIKKVGLKVAGHFTKPFRDCKFAAERDTQFVEAVNLGAMAKARDATTKATVGLADLAATVLRWYLPKDPAICISTEWENRELPETHVTYATRVVYATWLMFQVLSATDVGKPIDSTTSGGTPISLFSPDLSLVVAHGHLAPDRPKQYKGINVMKTRAVVTITKIVIPGHLVSGELLPSHTDTPLSSLLKVPFNMVCKVKHLQTQVKLPPKDPESLSPHDVLTPIQPATPATKHHDGSTSSPDTSSTPQASLWFDNLDQIDPLEQKMENSVADPAGVEKAQALKTEVEEEYGGGASVLPSRVLGDIRHLMAQLPISQAHGLHCPFARALRSAFFDYDIEDKTTLTNFLAEKNVMFEDMLREHPGWLLQRVKRLVPKPEKLFERVHRVFTVYGPLKDAKDDSFMLFNDAIWKIAGTVLKNIHCGFYSDPHGIPLYYTRSRDKYGLGASEVQTASKAVCTRTSSDGLVPSMQDLILQWSCSVTTCCTTI